MCVIIKYTNIYRKNQIWMKKYLTLHEEVTRVKEIMGIKENTLYGIKDEILYNIEDEIEEIERTVIDLNQKENLGISIKDVVESFMESEETTLTREIWDKLENTESNTIEKGDFDSVQDIANIYGKMNPNKLKKIIESGEYKRPLILNFGDRYYLIAGNTRLMTAAAMGVEPKVFIGRI